MRIDGRFRQGGESTVKLVNKVLSEGGGFGEGLSAFWAMPAVVSLVGGEQGFGDPGVPGV
ncbi:unnamed protein product, partial [marine sediment metagenome]